MTTTTDSKARSRVDGKTALVTGAGNGIGRATARELALSGAHVVVSDISAEHAERTAAEIVEAGGDAISVAADIALEDDVRSLFTAATTRFGSLDILVNNAGIGGPMLRLHETETADFDRVLAVNLRGTYLCLKYSLPLFVAQRDGRIVNIASTYGIVAAPKTAAYCTTKAGILNLTRQVAVDYGGDGIRANAVCPGYIDTRDGKRFPESEAGERARRLGIREAAAARQPLGRQGSPSEVADAVVYLASDASSFVTGATLTVDGGCVTTFNYGEASN